MELTDVTEEPKIVLKTKLTFSEAMAYRIYIFYRKPLILILAGWGVLAFVRTAFTYHKNHEFPWDGVFVVIFFFVVFPVFIYFSTKSVYSSDPRIKKIITYTFTKEKIQLNGDSFSTGFTWGNVIRIAETKRWILLYHNSQSANIIPKKDMPEQDLVNLRMLIREKPLIPSKLKG